MTIIFSIWKCIHLEKWTLKTKVIVWNDGITWNSIFSGSRAVQGVGFEETAPFLSHMVAVTQIFKFVFKFIHYLLFQLYLSVLTFKTDICWFPSWEFNTVGEPRETTKFLVALPESHHASLRSTSILLCVFLRKATQIQSPGSVETFG